MAGYGLLADIYSTIDSTKRKVGDALANPVETFKGHIAQSNKEAGEHLGMLRKTFQDAQGRPAFGSDMSPESRAATDQIAGEMLGGIAGATVWHGSPHAFKKFDSSKIGTGEGNQSFGRGLYLAENPEVARAYQQRLATNYVDRAGAQVGPGDAWTAAMAAAMKAGAPKSDHARAIATQIQNWVDAGKSADTFLRFNRVHPDFAPSYQAAAQSFSGLKQNRGSLYRVDLPDEQLPHMLDWDKKIQAQSPAVKERLDAVGIDPSKHHGTGGGLIGELGGAPGRIPDMPWIGQGEQYLQRAGIPGLRYLDGISRDAGRGTSNFVVFPGEEGMLQILERNGKPIK